MNQWNNMSKGFFKENPVFVLFLGLCPTLGVTTSAFNGLGMGTGHNFRSADVEYRGLPDQILYSRQGRIPSYIVVIASFVTIVELVMQAFVPDLFDQLGLFIPLIVVNCLVLGRAEAYASKNNLLTASIDGLGMGLGFTMALVMLGGVREILGSGSIFGLEFINGDAMLVFVLPPGAFLALGYLIVIINKLRKTET